MPNPLTRRALFGLAARLTGAAAVLPYIKLEEAAAVAPISPFTGIPFPGVTPSANFIPDIWDSAINVAVTDSLRLSDLVDERYEEDMRRGRIIRIASTVGIL